jgi:hypothetical protein
MPNRSTSCAYCGGPLLPPDAIPRPTRRARFEAGIGRCPGMSLQHAI